MALFNCSDVPPINNSIFLAAMILPHTFAMEGNFVNSSTNRTLRISQQFFDRAQLNSLFYHSMIVNGNTSFKEPRAYYKENIYEYAKLTKFTLTSYNCIILYKKDSIEFKGFFFFRLTCVHLKIRIRICREIYTTFACLLPIEKSLHGYNM